MGVRVGAHAGPATVSTGCGCPGCGLALGVIVVAGVITAVVDYWLYVIAAALAVAVAIVLAGAAVSCARAVRRRRATRPAARS
ncbi:MAG TPA: hypothetical protein VGG54_22910 [Trebonia sp.]